VVVVAAVAKEAAEAVAEVAEEVEVEAFLSPSCRRDQDPRTS